MAAAMIDKGGTTASEAACRVAEHAEGFAVAERIGSAAPAEQARERGSAHRLNPDRLVPLLYLAVAIVTRMVQFGNPIVHMDEQFYLLVGDRMLHGALPYVDIWDRKPIGLFLIYAAIRLLGGSGVLQYQLVATLVAAATAIVVRRLALPNANPRGALLAGLLYLGWLPLMTGQGGQAPVFYNLMVAAAALIVQGTLPLAAGADAPGRARRPDVLLVARGVAAMVSIGAAIQVKYSVVPEGALFGLLLFGTALRTMRLPLAIRAAALWLAAALLPTAAAYAGYAWLGHAPAFIFANFTSIFRRGQLLRAALTENAATFGAALMPLLILAALGLARVRSPGRWFVLAWLVTAVLSAASLGYWFDHYALPVVVPAAVAAAPLLGAVERRRPIAALFVVLLVLSLALPLRTQSRRGTPAQFAALVRAVRPWSAGGLLVWNNDSALYTATGAGLPSRYSFPTHLRDLNEQGAVGVDQPAELRRIFATPPAVVVIDQYNPSPNPATAPIVRTALAREYRRVVAVRLGERDQLVYVRRALVRPPAGAPGPSGARLAPGGTPAR